MAASTMNFVWQLALILALFCTQYTTSTLESEFAQAIKSSKLYAATQALIKFEILEKAQLDFQFALDRSRSVLEPPQIASLKNLSSAKGRQLNSKRVQVVAMERESKRLQCCLDSDGARSEWMKIALQNLEMQISCADFEDDPERPGIPALRTQLREAAQEGIASEVVGERLKVQDVSDEVGVGYFAACDIRKGDVLLVDSAFATANTQSGEDSISQNLATCLRKRKESEKVARFFKDRVLTLHAGGFQASPTPSGARGQDEDEETAMKVRWILSNNQFLCIQAQHLVSLFPAASRFNHACRPNAFVDSNGHVAIVRAIADIPAGTEVCVSYVPVLESRQDRQQRLRDKGILCQCLRCEAEAEAEEREMSGGRGDGVAGQRQMLHSACEMLKAPESMERSPEELIGHVQAVVDAARPLPSSDPLLNTVLNNLANLYYFSATRGTGGEDAMASFIACKVQCIQGLEELWAGGKEAPDSCPPCVSYVLQLYRMLLGTFSDEQQRRVYETKLRDVCRLLMGVDAPPSALTKHIVK